MNSTYIDNKKFGQAVHIIYDGIDGKIRLDDIAKKSCISIASLKRLFQEAISQSPGAFIRRLRMELAFCSLQDRKNSILEVALASGFTDQSAFARRFKETFGYSPSKAHEKINIVGELECVELEKPDIVHLKNMELQSITEIGLYFRSAAKAWDKLKEKLNDFELSDDFPGIFLGIGHDTPHEGSISANQVRFSACISHVERDIGTDCTLISGGQYAKFRYLGKPNNLGLAYHYIFGQWSDESALKIDNQKPAFIIFGRIPAGLEKQKIIIYVPIKKI